MRCSVKLWLAGHLLWADWLILGNNEKETLHIKMLQLITECDYVTLSYLMIFYAIEIDELNV